MMYVHACGMPELIQQSQFLTEHWLSLGDKYTVIEFEVFAGFDM